MLEGLRRRVASLIAPKNSLDASATRAGSAYDAGSRGHRTIGWRPMTTSPNTDMLYSLTTMRDRSRQAVRNDGYAKGAIDALVSNMVGTGIKPLSQAEDVEFRKAIQALFTRWTDESDADGRLDFYGQQSQATRAWLEAGEVFVRLRPRLVSDGLSVPLQLQIIEPELCPHGYFATNPQNGNKIRAGIECNGIGQRVAYWFYPSRTNDADEVDYGTLKRIPAESLLHICDPLRPGQLRGLPHLTQALFKLHELEQFDDATLLGQKLKNLFVAFLKTPAPDPASTINPLTGTTPKTVSDSEKPMISLEAGVFQELGPGEEVVFSNPPAIPQTYPDFMRQQLMGAAAAHGVPYEVWTGDMRGINDRLIRVVLQEFRRRIQARQHQILAFQFCRPVWNAVLDRVFLSGAVPIPVAYVENPEPWQRVKWSPQGWPYLNPVQDVQANRDLIRNGFTSRQTIVSEQGEDAETIDQQQAEDNARADDLELRYDSDGRQPTGSGASIAPAAESEPTTDPQQPPSQQEEGATA